MAKGRALRFKNADVPRQQGEVGRIRVLKGPDQGVTFVLKAPSLTIGRGEEVDLLLNDIKASRTHARIDFVSGAWVVSDLGSANGIFFQGEYIRKFGLTSHDHFTIGESILEFLTHAESTRVLTAPLRSSSAVQQQDQALSRQKMKVLSVGNGPGPVVQKSGAKKQNPVRTLILLAIVGGMYFYMNAEPTKPAAPAKKAKDTNNEVTAGERGLASYLPAGASHDAARSAEQSYWEGFREYREGHYLRAKEHFELALQVNPAHELARFYLKSANQEIEEDIKRMIAAAQKATASGRLREAKGYYETAMRTMYHDHNNPNYAECDEAVKKISEDLNRSPAGEGKP